jgi:hypothetical protein
MAISRKEGHLRKIAVTLIAGSALALAATSAVAQSSSTPAAPQTATAPPQAVAAPQGAAQTTSAPQAPVQTAPVTASTTAAAPVMSTPATAVAANDPKQIVCRQMEPETGTRLGSRRICQTNAQWDETTRETQENMRQMLQHGSTQPDRD